MHTFMYCGYQVEIAAPRLVISLDGHIVDDHTETAPDTDDDDLRILATELIDCIHLDAAEMDHAYEGRGY